LKEVPRPDRSRLRRDLRDEVFRDSVLPGLRHFAIARRLCPLLPRPHMRFAAHAGELVRADLPEKYWDRALELAPFDPDLRFFAGLQRLRDGKVDEAWAQWRKSLELTPRPKYPPQWMKYSDRLSTIVATVGRTVGPDTPRRADVLLKEVLPDRPDDLVAAARLLDPALSPAGPARPLLDKALTLLADRPEGLPAEQAFLKAQIHDALGEDEAAVRAYKHALSFAAARPEWRYQFVKLLMARGRWKEALAELPTLQKQMPNTQQVKEWIDEANRELIIQ
jgi:tetratricopeptide (TPR) repeat protein